MLPVFGERLLAQRQLGFHARFRPAGGRGPPWALPDPAGRTRPRGRGQVLRRDLAGVDRQAPPQEEGSACSSARRGGLREGVRGALRRATEADRGLLVGWFAAFAAEALGEDADPRGAARSVDAYLGTEGMGLYLWEERSELVSMAGRSRPTPNGVTVNYVYTPPEHRGRGYASACVAALSQLILDEGHRYWFLFTDLANPTSNKIYRAIGYEAVCDVDEYEFGQVPEGRDSHWGAAPNRLNMPS